LVCSDKEVNIVYQETDEYKQKVENQKTSNRIKTEFIPKRVLTYTFDNLSKNSKKSRLAIEIVNTCMSILNKQSTRGAYVYGPTGTGKTYLMGCIYNYFKQNGKEPAILYYPEFIRKIKLSAKYYPAIFIGFVALFLFVKLISIALIKYFPQYNSYLESSWFLDSNKWAPILLTILYAFVFIMGEIILNKQTLTKVEESVRTLFLAYLVLTAMTLQTSLIGRFAHYFSPFVALYIPMVLSKISHKKIKWILFYGIILVYLMMLLVLIYYKPDWYHVVPYRSVITDWLIGN